MKKLRNKTNLMCKSFKVVGLMSGSSLDGVDLALLDFKVNEEERLLEWEMVKAATEPYESGFPDRLRNAPECTALEFWKLHTELGKYYGNLILRFLKDQPAIPDLIASHGHTVFHNPKAAYTCQIGDPAAMSAVCSIPVIADFRSLDVAMGGQGAPLAPLVDTVLFQEYDAWLNLGGIANLCIRIEDKIRAWDITACNQIFNYLSAKAGQDFDLDGQIAEQGKEDLNLKKTMECWSYYQQSLPKSLGNEELRSFFFPLLEHSSLSVEDCMRTSLEHVTDKIADVFLAKQHQNCNILCTGGGALNKAFVRILRNKLPAGVELRMPGKDIIEYKEAILIALAGLYSWQKKPIFFGSVTGATMDNFGGGLYWNNSRSKNGQQII
jgi:anhydro-N-acetylmuramic acid kinase